MPTIALTLILSAQVLAVFQTGTPGTDLISEQNRRLALEHYRAGVAAMRDESWEKADHEFRAAVKLDRLLVMAHYGLGQTQMAIRNYPTAVQAFLDCRTAHLELAGLQQSDRVLADQRRDDEIRELRESLRLFQGGGAKAVSPQNTVLRLESRLQQLETDRRRGSATIETPAEFSLALGSAYFRLGKIEDAERAYQEAIRVNPKMGELHNNLAVIYMMTGRLGEAEKELKAAEKAGYAVNPRFKDDLTKAKMKAAATPR
jgi:tetratricopeptide (TPR) repeat protein